MSYFGGVLGGKVFTTTPRAAARLGARVTAGVPRARDFASYGDGFRETLNSESWMAYMVIPWPWPCVLLKRLVPTYQDTLPNMLR
jgi:hypothetical protein